MFEFPRVDQVDLSDTESLVVVDTNAWRRLDCLDELSEKKNLTIDLWDHHPDDGDLKPDWACIEPVGANITLMLRALKERRTLLTPIQATLFLIGLYEDTGSLTFPSSCAEDAYCAGYLLDRKADLSLVGHFLNPAYGQRQKDVLFELLKSARRSKVNGYRIAMGKLTVHGHVDNLAMVVHMYMNIANVDAAFGLFQSGAQNKCMVIGRAASEGLDVGGIMRRLGGGGHPAAGSAVLKGVNPDAIEEMIVALIAGNQQSSVKVSDLMSFPVFTVAADTSMAAAGKLLREKGCTGLPVVKDDRLVGILSRRDFKRLRKGSQLKSPVKAFMSSRIKTIRAGENPLRAAHIMIKYDIGRLPVVDNDRIIGIVTRTDTMRYFYDLLPD
jgi:nanoRNase/pAp phosphatase (c-di-AMP/oligoRNAs hydrolase)